MRGQSGGSEALCVRRRGRGDGVEEAGDAIGKR
jgi:hypothetical protein